MTYDERSDDLARYFLPNGTEAEIKELAERIQQAVEDYLGEIGK